MSDVDVWACARHSACAPGRKGWTAALPKPSSLAHLTPTSIDYTQPLSIHQHKEARALKSLKATGGFIRICVSGLVWLALHDKDGCMGRTRSTWGYSFYIPPPVIVLMDTGDGQPLGAPTLIRDCLRNTDGFVLMAQKCEPRSAVSSSRVENVLCLKSLEYVFS